jgi:hypothetical protein
LVLLPPPLLLLLLLHEASAIAAAAATAVRAKNRVPFGLIRSSFQFFKMAGWKKASRRWRPSRPSSRGAHAG